MKIAVWYHCLFQIEDRFLEPAFEVVQEQMAQSIGSGLVDSANEIVVGINGGEESRQVASLVIPTKARLVMHGLDCRNENLTLAALENWLPSHPDYYVLYFHSKGATRETESEYGKFIIQWRRCLMRHCVSEWRHCVALLDQGFDAVGAHWMPGAGPLHNQNIFAGNFWWAKASFLATLPSIYKRDRIKESGIKALESRYESEVWIGNGPRLPKAKDLHRLQLPVCDFNPSRFMRVI